MFSPRRTRPRLSAHTRGRLIRPILEGLEDRRLLAGSLQIQSAFLVNANDVAITAPAIGEMVFIRANWITSGLTSANRYVVGFTVDGVTLQSSIIQGQSGNNL